MAVDSWIVGSTRHFANRLHAKLTPEARLSLSFPPRDFQFRSFASKSHPITAPFGLASFRRSSNKQRFLSTSLCARALQKNVRSVISFRTKRYTQSNVKLQTPLIRRTQKRTQARCVPPPPAEAGSRAVAALPLTLICLDGGTNGSSARRA
jgi:hypothetical protein